MYSYSYSRASLEPQIEGLSTIMKMRTLPKNEDSVGPSVLGTRIERPSHLVLVPKSMATKDTSNHRHYQGGTYSQIVRCVGRILESLTQLRCPRRDP